MMETAGSNVEMLTQGTETWYHCSREKAFNKCIGTAHYEMGQNRHPSVGAQLFQLEHIKTEDAQHRHTETI